MKSNLYRLGVGPQVRTSGVAGDVAKGVGVFAALMLVVPVALIGGLALGSLGGGRR